MGRHSLAGTNPARAANYTLKTLSMGFEDAPHTRSSSWGQNGGPGTELHSTTARGTLLLSQPPTRNMCSSFSSCPCGQYGSSHVGVVAALEDVGGDCSTFAVSFLLSCPSVCECMSWDATVVH